MSTYNRILGFDRQTGSWQNVACNSTGALFVTGITSGGSVASEVTVLNQISGFATETKQDNMLSDLDQFKFTGDKLQVETISGFATSALQESSNTAQYGKLSTIAETSEISSSYLQGILTKASGLQQQTAKYTIDVASSLAPDTVPAFTSPPIGSGLDGWYFKNVALSQPSQIYYYSYINPTNQVPARQKTYTIGDITCGYCIVNMLSVNSTAGLVMLAIYSRPTGSGDTVPGFFKSRQVYTIPQGSELSQGMTVFLYWGIEPDSRLFPDVKRIECTLASSVGPCLPTENLAFLTLNTDSLALIGNSEYIVSHAGWVYDGENIHDIQFTSETNAAAGDASAANQELQLTQSQQSNTAICVRLDRNSYTADGNLTVHDARATGKLVDCVTQLTGINQMLNDLSDGTQQMYVTLSGADDSVSVMAFNESLSMPQSLTLTTSSGMRSLDVHVANQITGYASEFSLSGINDLILNQSALNRFQAEMPISDGKLDTIITNMGLSNTTLNGIKTQTDKLTFIDVEGDSALDNLKVIDNALNEQIAQFCFFTNEDTVNDLRVKQMGPVDVRNVTGESLTVSGSVGITADQSVAISGSVETHCFASNNGTDWHYIDSDSSGRLNVNARSHDGAGNAITSTSVSGTEIYTGLDVVCKGVVSVQNASDTELTVAARQYGSYGNVANNLASMLPSTATDGIDVSEWSYFVGAYEDYNGSTTGSIILEYSFDNITYHTLFNTQIFPTSSGSGPRRATIYKQDIPGVNSIRLRNDTSSTLTSVTLTLLGATL